MGRKTFWASWDCSCSFFSYLGFELIGCIAKWELWGSGLRRWCGLGCWLGSTRPLTGSLLRGSRPMGHIPGCQDWINSDRFHLRNPLPLVVSNTPVKPHDCSRMAAHIEFQRSIHLQALLPWSRRAHSSTTVNMGSASILHIVRAIVFPDLGTGTIDRFCSHTVPVLERSHQGD